MPYRKIVGSDILFSLDPAGATTYELVMCQTGLNLGITNNIIDAATKCGPDSRPGKQDQNLSFEGQMVLSPVGLQMGIAEMFTLAQNKTEWSWRSGPATPVSGDIVYTGRGFFGELTQNWPNDENATFNVTVGVVGTIVQTVTV